MKHYVTYESRDGSHWARGQRGPDERKGPPPNPLLKLIKVLFYLPLLPFVVLTMLMTVVLLPVLSLVDRGRGR